MLAGLSGEYILRMPPAFCASAGSGANITISNPTAAANTPMFCFISVSLPLLIARRPVPSPLDPGVTHGRTLLLQAHLLGSRSGADTWQVTTARMKPAEWRTGRSHEEGLQPGQEARDLLPIRPIARRLRKADPVSHLLHEGADKCRTLWLNFRMHSWSARRSLRGSSLASAAPDSNHGAERFGEPMLRWLRSKSRPKPRRPRSCWRTARWRRHASLAVIAAQMLSRSGSNSPSKSISQLQSSRASGRSPWCSQPTAAARRSCGRASFALLARLGIAWVVAGSIIAYRST